MLGIARATAAMVMLATLLACGSTSEREPAALDLPIPDRATSRVDVGHERAEASSARTEPAAARPMLMVLGIAQDAGVPQAGCDCPRCRAAAADPGASPRVASLALALADGRVLLVDATPDLPWQLRDVAALRGDPPGSRSRTPVAGVLLTHGHMGHYLGLAHLGFEAAHADRVAVYGTESMLALLRGHAPWSALVEREEIELHRLVPSQPLLLDDVRVVPISVPHRAELTDTVGFRFEGPARTALYVPDCAPWSRWEPAAREALLDGVDVALLDGTFYSGDELPGRDLSKIGHPLMVDTMRWLEQRPDAPTVRLIHLNHSNPALDPRSEARAELERHGLGVATRGETFAL